MKTCDLHLHSYYSDGTCSPREVLLKAKEEGLSAVALTDHNTIKGLNEFISFGEELGIETVAGVEITCEFIGKEIHMLALFLTPENYPEIENLLNNYVKKEEERNVMLASKLNGAGYEVDYSIMKEEYGDNINRVHFAKELLKLGYVSSIQNAFDTILKEGAGFYTVPKRLSALEVVSFIKKIGAVSVWAHPALSLSNSEIVKFLKQAVPQGLNAMETDYTTYTAKQTEFLKNLAIKFNLLFSGGSDFHGANKPATKIGVGYGNLNIPYTYLENLKKIKVV